ncbi:hypothetical protein FRC11_009737 [Ceratobasidium sp. 423]|nr:hypothetical protein FRC11_009737 [Ceratobasidium sp. 423]
MPPSLSLGSLIRTPSLNRHSRGRPTSTTSESLPFPSEWLHFAQYTGEKSTLPCEKRALIVGIEYLEGEQFDDGTPMYLAGCHADANDVLDLLRKNGEYPQRDIRILADVPGLPDNQRPTRENIIKGLLWLSEGCRASDRRFFHYAGHGTQVQDKDGDEEDGYDEGERKHFAPTQTSSRSRERCAAIQPVDWATKYQYGDEGLIIDDEFRDFLVDPLPSNSTLTALVDCCHSGTILDMEQETRAVPSKSQSLGPMPRGVVSSVPSKPSLILKMRFCRSADGSILPVGNILELPELANVKSSDEPITPGAERGPIAASEPVVLEMKNIESPIRKRIYKPIVANVVCWSACLDSQLAWNKPEEINDRGVLTSAFTSGMRGAAAKYNAMPGAFHPEQRAATYAELFDYIREQERLAYTERKDRYEETHLLYQDPQKAKLLAFMTTPRRAPTRSASELMPPREPEMDLDEDLPFVRSIMAMFLNNQMNEAEEACRKNDKSNAAPRLYVRTASALMQSMTALMSFETDDVVNAQRTVQRTLNLADQGRLSLTWSSRISSFPFDAAIANARRMSREQLHAELIYAESLLEKAIMGFVSSGDWMSFLREALNIRSVVAIYRTLNSYIEEHDEKIASKKSKYAVEDIDADFRSGVYLGMGMCLLVFSLIPSRVVIFADLLGYKGDRIEALRLLRKAGGWGSAEGSPDRNRRTPRVTREKEGVRRPLCDLVLIVFHLVMSGFTREGVDVHEAENIVEWNLQQYPQSIFFLFGKGRLYVTRSQPDLAIPIYENARAKINGQKGYEQLGSVMLWEMALCHLSLGRWKESAACWKQMIETAKWSKAVYAYGRAACLLQSGNLSQEEQKEVDSLMAEVPTLRQRIAGKSIPLEKYVARKAERYLAEKTLVAPAIELAYMLQATYKTTEKALRKHVDTLRALRNPPLTKQDDIQMVNLLLAVHLRLLEYPSSEDVTSPSEKLRRGQVDDATDNEAEILQLLNRAKDSGGRLQQEYWVAYFAHYELGRYYEERGEYIEARKCFAVVSSGSSLEGQTNARRGKYSLQASPWFPFTLDIS